MSTKRDSASINVAFSVPFVHRLRFTQDVFGAEQHVLAELLEPSGTEPARVQFWVDANVAQAAPALVAGIRQFPARFADRVAAADDLQIVPGGEELKNDIHVLEQVLRGLHRAELDRRSYVVVVGGGRFSTRSGLPWRWRIAVCG